MVNVTPGKTMPYSYGHFHNLVDDFPLKMVNITTNIIFNIAYSPLYNFERKQVLKSHLTFKSFVSQKFKFKL